MIEFLEINYFIFVQKKNLVFIPEKKRLLMTKAKISGSFQLLKTYFFSLELQILETYVPILAKNYMLKIHTSWFPFS